LIQTVGRAARHVNGRAIFYADRITDSMKRCIEETARRRTTQQEFNAAHGITPLGVRKSVDEVRFITRVADARMPEAEENPEGSLVGIGGLRAAENAATYEVIDLPRRIAEIEQAMYAAAKEMDFETAARLRDELFELRVRAGDAAPRATGNAAAAQAKAGRAPGARGGRKPGARRAR
jgi:excinuclease ABC subunit B